MARTSTTEETFSSPPENPTANPGYRALDEVESALMAKLRDTEGALALALAQIENLGAHHGDREAMRWLGMARNNLETGMMFAYKAVCRPTDGLGRRTPK